MVCSSVEEESVNEPLELCERVKESEERERSELVLCIPTGYTFFKCFDNKF
ncbi:hypothetical protein Hanom_Chr16g01509411 [Helianthus anomalus]